MTIPAVYDLARCPPSYDAVVWLSALETERRGQPAHIHFLPGPKGGFRDNLDRLWPHTIEGRRALLDNVAVPLCRLLPACQGITVHENRPTALNGVLGHNQYWAALKMHVCALRGGSRPLRAPGPVEPDPGLVTITLREAEHWPDRNSRVDEWCKAGLCMQDAGYRVVIVRDTCKADQPVGKFETDPEASRSIEARATLYASARLNMGVCNGPMWMAIAMNARVAMLRPVTDGGLRVHGSEYFKANGLDRGGQLPTSPPYQRLFWADDTAEEIVSAFEKMIDA